MLLLHGILWWTLVGTASVVGTAIAVAGVVTFCLACMMSDRP